MMDLTQTEQTDTKKSNQSTEVELVHLIYCSAAAKPFSPDHLLKLLEKARHNNIHRDITGMLLYTEGSFFQILEGNSRTIDALFDQIRHDTRHSRVTLIIREPIVERSFSDWTMGYADIKPSELDDIVGANDFFTSGKSFLEIGPGRAQKLLTAFREGRWRSSLSEKSPSAQPPPNTSDNGAAKTSTTGASFTFAFQPIIHAPTHTIFSYEALIRGPSNEAADVILQQIRPAEMQDFHERFRVRALELAAKQGLSTRININFLPSSLGVSPVAIASLLQAGRRLGIQPNQIVLEILESELIRDYDYFTATLNEYRGSGMTFAIDDFGAGYAGLNLLAEFQPDFVKLDMHLVRGIDSNGPRQAIVRGIVRTCRDLGIDVIAEGVETTDEYAWFRSEGIELFQGFLFAVPAFEELVATFYLPDS